MPKILSTHRLHPRASSMLTGAGELVVASALDAATLAAEARDADVIIVRAPLPGALFEGATKLRAAIRHGAGLDMVPTEAANAAGVLVANVPGVNARSVAEYVMFAALALLRRFRVLDRDLRAKGWLAGREHTVVASELAGKT
ncbi:MAG: dehydrogenase, partial [Mesorhizobium sp.]